MIDYTGAVESIINVVQTNPAIAVTTISIIMRFSFRFL